MIAQDPAVEAFFRVLGGDWTVKLDLSQEQQDFIRVALTAALRVEREKTDELVTALRDLTNCWTILVLSPSLPLKANEPVYVAARAALAKVRR